MSEDTMDERDTCPHCNNKSLIMLLNSKSTTYSAPKNFNGRTEHTIRWCQKCGTIKQFTDYGISKVDCSTLSLVKIPECQSNKKKMEKHE